MLTPIPDRARKGRGAVGNPTGRYERLTRQAVADGWERAANPDERDGADGRGAIRDTVGDGAPGDGTPDGARPEGERPEEDQEDAFDDAFRPPPLRTIVGVDAARRVITRNQSPDLGFDRSINPYRGCEHGCVYCFARPTHAYLGLSPGLDFESRLFAKPDAAKLLRAELSRPAYRRRPIRPIAMGTNTDPYQPVERERQITRQILEVLAEHEHPVSIVTKSALVARDIDILAPMAEMGLASVAVSVTTLDRGLARRMEPRAATPVRRLETIAALSEAGIPTAAMVAPVIPALTDHEMEAIIEAAAKAGAVAAGWILLRLPLEIKDLFADWLAEHTPYRANHVLGLVRGARGGRLNDPNFGTRLSGTGEYAKLIGRRFQKACARAGLATETPKLDVTRFRVPADAAERAQLRLL